MEFPRVPNSSSSKGHSVLRSLRRFLTAFWDSHQAKVALTAFCILVAIFDTFWKSLSIIAACALALGVVPWVVGIIEKLDMPGGFGVVFRNAEKRLDATPTVPEQKDIDAFSYLSGSDPNAAIAYLRIQIERTLRKSYEELGLEATSRRPPTIRTMAEELWKRGAITHDAVALISDLSPVMNQAAHGIHLSDEATVFALEYGPRILSLLRTPDD